MRYFKYFCTNIVSLADYVVHNFLLDENEPDHGFGSIYKWRSLQRGFEEARETGKPIFLLIHKTTCPACIRLKEKFSKSMKLIELSRNFVMINVENSSDTLKDEKFTPDGKYVPRILFFTSAGELIRSAYNRHAEADVEHRYFYSSPVQIVEVMQQVVKEFT